MPPIQRVESDQRTRPLPVSKAEMSTSPDKHHYDPDTCKVNLYKEDVKCRGFCTWLLQSHLVAVNDKPMKFHYSLTLAVLNKKLNLLNV